MVFSYTITKESDIREGFGVKHHVYLLRVRTRVVVVVVVV